MIETTRKMIDELKDYDGDSYDEPIEIKEALEKPSINLEEITAKQLLIYFAERFKQTHGYEYVVSWVKEIGILKSYLKRYGKDAGPMVEYLFDSYGGMMNGQIMTITAFSTGAKWIQDLLYIQIREIKNSPKIDVEGLMDGSDFLTTLGE